jgi:hypothetical protein
MADAKTKKVRVLTETRHKGDVLKHNQVVEMTDDEIKAQAGAVDPHPDAVAHAEGVAAEIAAAAAKKG